MAREKKPVHRVQMAEGKRNIIHQLLEEYDILIICADGLTGIKEAIAAAFPKTEYQRYIRSSDKKYLEICSG